VRRQRIYNPGMTKLRVSTFYLFCELPDFAELREPLLQCALQAHVKGTILLAAEGVNGTIAGDPAGVEAVLDAMRAHPALAALQSKDSTASEWPFQRTKVKLKSELVPFGVDGVDAAGKTGTHVAPRDWNALISEPDVLLVDARNDFETEIGQFEGAVDPNTHDFRQFASWLDERLAGQESPRVAMYCTGGIRCEKASAYLKARGIDEVYQLEGGILKYLEEIPPEQSLWQGECFVFDERVALAHGLEPGSYRACADCGRAVALDPSAAAHLCAKSALKSADGSGNSESI